MQPLLPLAAALLRLSGLLRLRQMLLTLLLSSSTAVAAV
jgi:hypothetical protein